MEFVNDFDSYARCIFNVLDDHAYETMWKKRKHIICSDPSLDRAANALLNRKVYIEGKSDLGEMQVLRSELIFQFQNSLGEILGVPKELQKEAIHVRFDMEERGNLVPYYPAHLKLSGTFMAMLTCLYPFPIFRYDVTEGIPEEIDYITEEVAHMGYLERARNWKSWNSFIAPNRLLKMDRLPKKETTLPSSAWGREYH